MNFFDNISDIQRDEKTILTIGTFDGVHKGHQQIIKKVVEISKQDRLRNLIITFHPHPKKVINPDIPLYLLTTTDEQKQILKELGVENHLVINFTKSFSELTSYQFIKEYVVEKIGVNKIVVGYDHHFGRAREGNADFLRKISNQLGFEVIEIPSFQADFSVISSTLIRKEILSGNILNANKMLGRYYFFSGKVIIGDGRGRTLGYPTANIMLDEEDKLLPMHGIYASFITVKGIKYKGLLSVGRRPTFYNNGTVIPEVYIYDFQSDIYGETVKVEVVEKIRKEEKFKSAEELVNQMNLDKVNGLKILNNLNQLNN
jgi:riboflavin kinase/FMN adenylyltransferase